MLRAARVVALTYGKNAVRLCANHERVIRYMMQMSARGRAAARDIAERCVICLYERRAEARREVRGGAQPRRGDTQEGGEMSRCCSASQKKPRG